jgi:cell division protein FtsL
VRDGGVVRLGKPVDNSRVVRQVDPRSRREIWLLILLVALLAAGLGLYAWPALEIRRAGQETVDLYREKERLLEQKRKLQLEKAALENLGRVEDIATRELGLAPPAPERSIVVEVPRAAPPDTTVAGGAPTRREARAAAPAPAASPAPEARP